MLKLKETIAKILQSLIYQRIVSITYTTTTAYSKAGTATFSKNGIYRIQASWSNAGVLGIALSATSALFPTIILHDGTQQGRQDILAYIEKGTYSVWAKCSAAGKSNSIHIYQVLVL